MLIDKEKKQPRGYAVSRGSAEGARGSMSTPVTLKTELDSESSRRCKFVLTMHWRSFDNALYKFTLYFSLLYYFTAGLPAGLNCDKKYNNHKLVLWVFYSRTVLCCAETLFCMGIWHVQKC